MKYHFSRTNQAYFLGLVKNNLKRFDRNIIFFVGVICIIVTANSIIFYVQPLEKKTVYTNLILISNSAIATALSIFITSFKLIKERCLDQHLKTHIALTIGLTLWLCANILWWTYETDDVIPDVPSQADLFWFSAYPFFIYAGYSTFKVFYKKYENKWILFASLIFGISLIFYTILIATNLSILSSYRGILLFATVISYPILNVILIIPAISISVGFRKESEFGTARVYEFLSLVSLIVADSWFLVIFLSNNIEAIWYSNLLVIDHYILISSGLLWTVIPFVPTKSKRILSNPIFIVISIISITVAICFYFLIFNNNHNPINNDNNNLIKIGALLGLSGSSYESGLIQMDIFNQAVNDINKNFVKSNSSKRIDFHIVNTEINPDIALEKTKDLVKNGIKIIIGPQTSGELKKIEQYVDSQDILIISQSSTSPSLAKIDNIYRLLQNDKYQGPTIAKKMYQDGKKIIIPIWTDNKYGNDLYNTTKNSFEKLGGKFTKGVKYPSNIGQFAGSLHRINFMIWDQMLKNISNTIINTTEYIGGPNPYSKIGVYLISYGELVPLFIQAPSHPDLDKVKWYGSEATAKNQRLLKHEKAADFAVKTNFTTPALSYNTKNKNLQLLENETKHHQLDPSDVNSYDAVWIASLAANIAQNTTFANSKDRFINALSSYHGLSGDIKLDKYGDRLAGYDFWTLRENSSKGYEWINN
jgi:branched-chain amino acid transport system substrate-binding protein